MATYFQQWAPQRFQQDTAYQSVDNPAPPAPSNHSAKPAEYFVREDEVRNEPFKPKQTFYQANFGGLKRTLRVFLGVVIIILVINVSWLGYAKTHYGGIESGYGLIQRGDCDKAKSTNKWLHLLINTLSTLLLTGSNAFMAAYCCPSREEIDVAHRQRKWLHIGMLSIKNFRNIAKRKSFVVALLALSSIPFHLLSEKSSPDPP